MIARLHSISASAATATPHKDAMPASAKAVEEFTQPPFLGFRAPIAVPACSANGESSDEDTVLVDRP
jgi:hypothetical protein